MTLKHLRNKPQFLYLSLFSTLSLPAGPGKNPTKDKAKTPIELDGSWIWPFTEQLYRSLCLEHCC